MAVAGYPAECAGVRAAKNAANKERAKTMWIASKYGFFSIVKKNGGWHIRARNRTDLPLLQKAVGGEFGKLVVHTTRDADYISRVFIQDSMPGAVSDIMRALGDSVDYSNFKNHIHDNADQQDKLPAYSRVWSHMHAYQSERDYQT